MLTVFKCDVFVKDREWVDGQESEVFIQIYLGFGRCWTLVQPCASALASSLIFSVNSLLWYLSSSFLLYFLYILTFPKKGAWTDLEYWKVFQWVFLLLHLVLEASAGGLTLMTSDRQRVGAVEQNYVSPHSWESPEPVAEFLPASCCILSFTSSLSSSCHEPAGGSVYVTATVRSGVASGFSEKQTIFFHEGCLHSSPAAETHTFLACQSLNWIKTLWFNGFVTRNISTSLHQSHQG